MKNKQNKIAGFLKLLTLVLAVMGIVFFSGMTYFETLHVEKIGWPALAFTWYSALLCYLILFQFYKVTREIGKDNSFSLENRNSFHRMGQFGLAACAGFFVHLLYDIFFSANPVFLIFLYIFLILLSLIFFGLCEALSQLIENAYQVKLENELTI